MCGLWLQKEGNQAEEYEDAYWPAVSSTRTGRVIRCAIADGATEASFSGLWAGMLAEAFGKGSIRPRRLDAALPRLQSAWWSGVNCRPLPWYAEQKMRSGAFSSLLGLTLSDTRANATPRWSAMAVGDSCLFLVRDGRLMASFPIGSSRDFGNSPLLICSIPSRNSGLESNTAFQTGWCGSGDSFYLLTDALARWFLAVHEMDGRPWNTLDHVVTPESSQAGFAEWICGERRANRMRNDDVTMLRLRLD